MVEELGDPSPIAEDPASLDLSHWPSIYVSTTHFDTEDLHELEDELASLGAPLTYDISEAAIIFSKVLKKNRIQFDLRAKGLWTKELQPGDDGNDDSTLLPNLPTKKRKHDEVGRGAGGHESQDNTTPFSRKEAEQTSTYREQSASPARQAKGRTVRVVKLDWLQDSRLAGHALPLDQYVTYRGQCIERTATQKNGSLPPRGSSNLTATSLNATASKPTKPNSGSEILQRAQADSPASGPKRSDRFGRRKFGLNTPSANPSSWEAGHGTNVHLLQQSTTEYEGGSSSDLPEMPEWVKKGVKYACQRLTPMHNPNDAFIEQLKKIKLARLLTNDEIGVRAYSTSIASLAAYTYEISNPREILALPGCSERIANYFVEWKNTGKIKAIEDLEADEDLKIIRTFYDIWGVGNTTAREFYYERGWRDLDDIVEYGWKDLTRVQQIGVKYYDEFLDLIPRAEVEQIGEVIRRHAIKVRDERLQTMLVGGYRRGKEASGDVDIIVSHPDESATLNLVNDLVTSLEEEEWITHTLVLSLNSTKRQQETLPFRSGGGGHGFDTLDKALVVWQDPAWPTKARDVAENPKAKNPNIHRRVDIIVSPWRTVGCAVVGWSGGTTFERDLRRFAKNSKTWKFDSSGVRHRASGQVVDLEGYFEYKGEVAPQCRAKTMEEAERRVFEGFGLTFRKPTERCTG